MSNTITIYKQIYPSQCQQLAHFGYRSLINIRPDNEAANQPLSETLNLAAKKAHLAYAYIPYDEDRLSCATIASFAEQYHKMPKPIMLFCGSGARAKLLYQSALMQGLL
ncbi:beta-lactamase hydrolase domain-containing protein [Psychrobacter lutiphocae]|uniref:beta-lactamase hydrolase domain-containing protein n=1 Tax=Psychrobacter lutiphocae TaxID=540500 RepID=UPI00037186CB|nr:sulfur transferase domain-containing protein [Psychrobacter lutiphocae]